MNITKRIINKLFSILEKCIYINWFNPIITIYVNFRILQFSQAIKLPIWLYGRPKIMNLSGQCIISSAIKPGMIRINYNDTGSPDFMKFQTEINIEGTIVFNGICRIRTGNRIVVGYGAILQLGRDTLICDNVAIGCLNRITIGDNTWITHRCQIYDSNYHFTSVP